MYACRENATLFSVEVSSSCRASMFWLALRSGYASATAVNLPSAPASAPCVWASCCMAAGSPGLLFAAASPEMAAVRACVTASSVSRSCAM